MYTTHNQGTACPEFGDPFLEFFSKAGSHLVKSDSYYEDTVAQDLARKFHEAYGHDPLKAMKLLFWLRDPRGGAGNRGFFRQLVREMVQNFDDNPMSEWILANIHNIPTYGRFDDITNTLYVTDIEKEALDFLAQSLINKNGLCAKWLSRNDRKLKNYVRDYYPELGITTNKEFRKLLVSLTRVVETQMCNKEWDKIKYESVPSIAAVRYSKAFTRHDAIRYKAFIDSGNKMQTSTAFPHEIFRIFHAGPDQANKFFESLSGKWETSERILPLCDTSGSMKDRVSGSIRAIDVAIGLTLFLSDRLEGPFHRQFLTFSAYPKLFSWKDDTPADVVGKIWSKVPWDGSTNISRALDMTLQTMVLHKIPKEKQINHLIILSDMQFDRCTAEGRLSTLDHKMSVYEKQMLKWEAAGYDRPGVIFWCIKPYRNQPTGMCNNTALISGFSKSILKELLTNIKRNEYGEIEFNAEDLMNEVLEKYDVTIPRSYLRKEED